MVNPKVVLITLGDELLLGTRTNSILSYIGSELGRYGISLHSNYACRDCQEDLESIFRFVWEGADVVLITNGLAHNTDYKARETIGKILGKKSLHKPELEAAIRQRFEKLDLQVNPDIDKLCDLPEGAEWAPNPYAVTPGVFIEEGKKSVYILPGPRGEMIPLFKDEVIPRLERHDICNPDRPYLQIRTAGLSANQVTDFLAPIQDEFPDINFTYIAYHGVVDIRLSSSSPKMNQEIIKQAGDRCREKLDNDFVCFGDDTLAKVVFDHLRADENTLAIAESCTGGLLSNAFTDIPGASKVFLGGVVCYNNDTKMELLGVPESMIQQHGSVSAEVSVAMATDTAERLSADYALSITGFAGPSGGTPETPVGTVFIGFHSPFGTWGIRVNYSGDRLAIKARAVNHALDFMRRKINKYRLTEAFTA